MRTTRIVAAAVAAFGLAGLVFAQSANATFAGFNGLVYFVERDDQGDGDPDNDLFALKSIRPDGSGGKTLVDFSEDSITSVQASPDGTGVVYQQVLSSGSESHIYLINADGSDKVDFGTDTASPQWAPDGSHIVYTKDGTTLELRDASGSNQLDLGSFSTANWLPDSSGLVANGGSSGDWSLHRIDTEGGASVIVENLADFPSVRSVSPNSQRVLFESQVSSDNVAYTVPVSGGIPIQVINGYYDVSSFSWSVDSGTIFFVAQDNSDTSADIFSLELTSDTYDQLTDFNLGVNSSLSNPSLSPDGTRIAFEGILDDGSDDIITQHVVSTDGSGLVSAASQTGALCGGFGCESYSAQWSPNSAQLLLEGSIIVYSLADASLDTIFDGDASSMSWATSATPLTGIGGSGSRVLAAGLGAATIVGTVTLAVRYRTHLPRFRGAKV